MKKLILIIAILAFIAVPLYAGIATDLLLWLESGTSDGPGPVANQAVVDADGKYRIDADGKYQIGATP